MWEYFRTDCTVNLYTWCTRCTTSLEGSKVNTIPCIINFYLREFAPVLSLVGHFHAQVLKESPVRSHHCLLVLLCNEPTCTCTCVHVLVIKDSCMYMYMYMYRQVCIHVWLGGPRKRVLIREASLVPRLICAPKYTIGTSETVLNIEIPYFRG